MEIWPGMEKTGSGQGWRYLDLARDRDQEGLWPLDLAKDGERRRWTTGMGAKRWEGGGALVFT
jgi:hypothetical protein